MCCAIPAANRDVMMFKKPYALLAVLVLVIGGAVAGCTDHPGLPSAAIGEESEAPLYRIGPGDALNIFVWRNPDLTASVPVRPDGRISVPLIEDLNVTGKTPSALSREIETHLGQYVQDPIVTVIVTGFVGPFNQQVRVVGEATLPQAIPYSANMTLLDVMIAVGGLTPFADGNGSTLIRVVEGAQTQYNVLLADLVKDGDIGANVEVLPGDVIIVPESFF
jgi:polysaccharide export outer membrane protein